MQNTSSVSLRKPREELLKWILGISKERRLLDLINPREFR